MLCPSLLLLFCLACVSRSLVRESQTTCSAGSILDGSLCVPASCGVGSWGGLPVDEETVYVDGSAEAGGDGTEAMPFTTIQRGLNRAGVLGGGLVAVASGVYPETLELTSDHANVHLAGRCRDLVILDASQGDGELPGIEIDAGYSKVTVTGVTLARSTEAGFVVDSGDVTLLDATIAGSAYMGVVARHSSYSGMTGVTMEGCLIEGSTDLGLLVSDPETSVTLRNTTVRDTLGDSNGWGVEVTGGAALSMESCLVEGNTDIGLIASGTGTSVTLRNTVLSETRPDGNGEGGRGLEILNGATLNTEGCLIERNADIGVRATGLGTRLIFHDTTVHGTRPDENGDFGWGVNIEDGATLSAEGCLIDGNAGIGLYADGPKSLVEWVYPSS